MRRKIITVIIVFLAIITTYFTNKLTTDYYGKSFYNVGIVSDKSEIEFGMNDENATINVSLINNSRKFISSSGKVFLSYHITDTEGNTVIYDNQRFSFPDIKPFNKQDMIPVIISNIKQKGEYIVQLDLVEEGVVWFSQKGNPVCEVKLVIYD